MKSTDFAARRR